MPFAESQQPPYDVGDIGAKHAAIDMHLINDNDAQRLEKLGPILMAWQDANVEHVRVGENHVA